MSILIHISYNLIIKGYKTKATQTKINKINLIFVNSLSFHLQTFASLVSVFKFRSPHLLRALKLLSMLEFLHCIQ